MFDLFGDIFGGFAQAAAFGKVFEYEGEKFVIVQPKLGESLEEGIVWHLACRSSDGTSKAVLPAQVFLVPEAIEEKELERKRKSEHEHQVKMAAIGAKGKQERVQKAHDENASGCSAEVKYDPEKYATFDGSCENPECLWKIPVNVTVTCRDCGNGFVTASDEPGKCPACGGARKPESV